MKQLKFYKILIIVTLISVLFDQLFKYIVLANLDLYNKITIIKNFFYLTYVRNFGAAYSVLTGKRFLLIVLTLIMCYLIYRFLIKSENTSKYDMVIYGMLYGGIFGNLIDRIFKGYVIDYLDFYIFSYNFPVFNFADILIVISMFIIIINMLRGDKNEDNN